jgi:hypothetical protein
MHIMQALVGCQKRSTKSLRRSLHPIAGVAGMRGSGSEVTILSRTRAGAAPAALEQVSRFVQAGGDAPRKNALHGSAGSDLLRRLP